MTVDRGRIGRDRTFVVMFAALLAIAGFAGLRAGATGDQTPQPRPRPPVIGAGTGAISGTVVDASTGKPVAGMVVYITPITGNTAGPGAKQVTDASGRFVFTDLEAGDGYSIGTIRYGYLDGGYGRESATASARRIVLADGQWFQNATIKVWKPGAINGTVIDEAGEPVAGAFVRVLALITVAGQPQTAAGPTTKTDDRGMYRIAGLPPGRYYVSVPSVQASVPAGTSALTLSSLTADRVAAGEASGRPIPLRRDPAIALDPENRLLIGSFITPPPAGPGTRPTTYPVYYYPASRDRASATAIDLAYGDDRHGIDLRIAPLPTFRISGRVVGPAEAIATNLTLRLLAAGDEGLAYGSEAATALVAPNGSFVFLNVPAGNYAISAGQNASEYTYSGSTNSMLMNDLPVPPATPTGGSGGSAAFSGPPGTSLSMRGGSGPLAAFFGTTRADVGSADLTDVVVTIRRGVTIAGRVVSETGSPGSGRSFSMIVSAEPANGDPSLGLLRSNSPRADLTQFAIDGLRPGEYIVRLIGTTAKSIVWNGKDYTHTPFDASAGQDFRDVVITTTSQTVRIDGAVRTPSGAPAAAAVIYFPVEREQWRRYGVQPSRMRSTVTGSSGAFSLTRIPAGEYFLVAVDETLANAWQNPAFLEAAALVASRVTVGWGETKTQDLVVQQVRVPKGARP